MIYQEDILKRCELDKGKKIPTGYVSCFEWLGKEDRYFNRVLKFEVNGDIMRR